MCVDGRAAIEARHQENLALARKAYDAMQKYHLPAPRIDRIVTLADVLRLGGFPQEQALALAKTTVRQADKKVE